MIYPLDYVLMLVLMSLYMSQASRTAFLCFAFCFSLMLMLSCEPGFMDRIHFCYSAAKAAAFFVLVLCIRFSGIVIFKTVFSRIFGHFII